MPPISLIAWRVRVVLLLSIAFARADAAARRQRPGGESAIRTYLLPISTHAILVAALLRLVCGGTPTVKLQVRFAVARLGTADLGRAEPSEPGLGSIAVAASTATITHAGEPQCSRFRAGRTRSRGFGALHKCSCWKVRL